MRVLHYALGLPPFRTGGLTKYCCDLMRSQVSRGHEVALVWPGRMGCRFSFKRCRPWEGVEQFELTDPLPVPYDEGIVSVGPYLESRDAGVCRRFLSKLSPDVLHVHTLMGLPRELVEAARELGIRTVFTTHDYYPLCPRVKLYRQGGLCENDSRCEACPACNAGGLSLGKIKLLQSPLYRVLKDSVPMRMARARHRSEVATAPEPASVAPTESAAGYRRLLERNLDLLGHVDVIHANSELAASIYRRHMPHATISVLPIGNSETQTSRFLRAQRAGGPVRFGYFGGPSMEKGLYLLLEACDILWGRRHDFELDLYGAYSVERPYVRLHPRYGYDEIDAVFARTDVTVVPSLWPETFGFQATESLCRGVPVAVSSLVGMRDLLDDTMGVVFGPTPSECSRALGDCLETGRVAALREGVRRGFRPVAIERVELLYGRTEQG